MLTLYVLLYTQVDSTSVMHGLEKSYCFLCSVVQKVYPKKKINVSWLERKCF